MEMPRLFVMLGCAALATAVMAADEPRGPPPGAGEHWAALDTDGDGAISQAEAQAGAPRMAGHFGRIDANGDGRGTREEAAQARERRREESTKRAEEHYRGADTNSDGSIDLAEAQTGMPRAAEHFGEIDADGNGLLTREEMHAAMQARRGERMRGGEPKK
jgi:hypothetical protein